MQLICVSRGSYSSGQAFAESLARKLGCACIGREEMLERATIAGIAAGKLEMACVNPRGLNERMMLEREHYQSFVTSALAEMALSGPLVYHGLTGHLLFKGIPHVLRLRVVTDMETRIKSVTNRLGLDRAKARKYIDELEEDRRKWVRTFYNIDWEQSRSYDFLINVEHANVENVASAFCAVAQLPEFHETPAARVALENLLLASRCRVALAEDDRTYYASFQVQADRGNVSISYQPRHLKVAESIVPVVEKVPGAHHIFATMAASRILWIQEHFTPTGETFQHVVEVAKKWGAAVELLRLEPAETSSVIEQATAGQDSAGATPAAARGTGGIEDDVPVDPQASQLREGGVEETFNELVKLGKAGGRMVVQGSVNNLSNAIDRSISYSLVVIGEVFLDKGKSARTRLSRELTSTLQERLRGVSVVQAEDMQERFLFGAAQLVTMLLCTAVTALIYVAVFTHQRVVLDFLTRPEMAWRITASASVVLFIPIVAYFSGKAVHYLLKLIKME
jgi:cytidylate kinase